MTYIEGAYNPRLVLQAFNTSNVLEGTLIFYPSSAPLRIIPDHIDETIYYENIKNEMVRLSPPRYRPRYQVEWAGLSTTEQRSYFRIVQRQMASYERIIFYPFYNSAVEESELTSIDCIITKKWHSFEVGTSIMGFELTSKTVMNKMINDIFLELPTQFGNIAVGRTAII